MSDTLLKVSNVWNGRLATAHRSDAPRQFAAAGISAALTAVSYLSWLGWHEPKHLVPGTSSYAGPHEAWQVIGLALTLGAVAAVGGWLRLVQVTVWATSITVSFMFALEATTEHHGDTSLWPVGTVMLFAVAFAGILVVALVFRGLHRAFSPRTSR